MAPGTGRETAPSPTEAEEVTGMSPETTTLAARLLVITGAAVSFAWWQWSLAAGLAFGLGLWAVAVMRPGGAA